MANYYTLCAALIPYVTQEQRQWLTARVERDASVGVCLMCHLNVDHCRCTFPEDGYLGCDWADRQEENAIWVHADESVNLDVLALLVCDYQKTFALDAPWACEFSYTCDQDRLDAYGGGAVVCSRGEAQWLFTHEWVGYTWARCEDKEATIREIAALAEYGIGMEV